ncbi:MAG: tyrosine--tRNA ligase [Candidatus Parcubacteria bacterium]|nr:tyrosine--tRNA ligase [Candidatus Parcubacteria bacterium]
MRTITDPQKIDEILNRGTIIEILPTKAEFRKRLLNGERLRFYIGFDATAPMLHLSHAKNFMLMEKFRKLGHEVIILFGDFTARIGDPSGMGSTRKQLSREEVVYNVKKWKKLVEPLMDFKDKNNPPKIMYNNNWLSKLNLEDLISLASNFTVQQMLKRDMYQKRLKEEKPIYFHEFLYPLMQGYDSVAMDVDVEVCGTDQVFNALVGRSLLKKIKNKDKYVVAVTLMENPRTGELMSKTRGIGVFLGVAPSEMYEQVMNQPDEMIEILFVNNTYLSLEEIDKLKKLRNPRDAKMRLAFEIVKICHSEKEAEKAQENFIKLFQKKEIPEDIKEIKAEKGEELGNIFVENKIISSKSEFRRLIKAGAIDIDGQSIGDINYFVEKPIVVKIGKKKFLRIKV